MDKNGRNQKRYAGGRERACYAQNMIIEMDEKMLLYSKKDLFNRENFANVFIFDPNREAHHSIPLFLRSKYTMAVFQ